MVNFYVVKKDEHLGPFTVAALKKLYKDGKLRPESLVWKEGMKQPQSIRNVFFRKKKSTVDSLPPIPTVGKDKIELPPLPSATTEASNQNRVKEHQRPKNLDPKKLKVEPKRSYSLVKHIIIALGILALFSTGVFFYGRHLSLNNSFARPELMSLKDFNRLSKTVALSRTHNQFSYALSQDKKSLWIATNSPLVSKVEVQLKSIKERSLGGDVVLKAHGNLVNHLIELNNFRFEKGTKLVDALYDIQIKSYGEDRTPFYQKYYQDFSTEINYKSKAFISNFTADEFKKILGKIILKKKKNTLEFWGEIAQKYQTVKVITEQIRKGIEESFLTPAENWNLAVINFENKYKTSWGKFFTEFVKANDKSYAKYSLKKFENQTKVLAYYNNLSNLAIQIGEESMKALEDLQAIDFKALSTSDKNTFKAKLTKALMTIEEECLKKVEEIKAL